MTRLLLALLIALAPGAARAGLAAADLAAAGLSVPAGAPLPLADRFTDRDGHALTLGDALAGRPALLLPVDFTCRTLCGPFLAVVSGALVQTGLRPGRDYRLIVLGLDPKDAVAEGRALLDAQVADPGLRAATVLLRGDAEAVGAVIRAAGYRTAYDAEHDQYAHPAAVLALTPDGHLARALSTLALTGPDLRLALLEAGRGTIGGVAGQIAVLCYGFDAAHGIYTLAITRVLTAAGAATVLGLGLWLLWLRQIEGSRPPPSPLCGGGCPAEPGGRGEPRFRIWLNRGARRQPNQRRAAPLPAHSVRHPPPQRGEREPAPTGRTA
ncbi:SCO family protein [Methylobacterium sp. JK268]